MALPNVPVSGLAPHVHTAFQEKLVCVTTHSHFPLSRLGLTNLQPLTFLVPLLSGSPYLINPQRLAIQTHPQSTRSTFPAAPISSHHSSNSGETRTQGSLS